MLHNLLAAFIALIVSATGTLAHDARALTNSVADLLSPATSSSLTHVRSQSVSAASATPSASAQPNSATSPTPNAATSVAPSAPHSPVALATAANLSQPYSSPIAGGLVLGAATSALDAVTHAEFNAALNTLRSQFSAPLSFSGLAASTPVSTAAFAPSQRIDQLNNATLSNITVNGVSGLTAADIPNDITASNYLPLVGGRLTGSLTGTDLTLSGNLTVSGATTTFSNGATFATSGGNVGIGTTSPYAKLSIAGQVVAQNFVATSTSVASAFPFASTTALSASSAISIGGITLSNPGGQNNYVVNAGANAIDTSVVTSVINGGGLAPHYINLIGSSTKPYGTDWTPTDWSTDTDYVPGSANVATISGGYDNIVNQVAGTISGGGHNFIKYNSTGHSVIGGGSYNLIDVGRSGIFSGLRNTITGTTQIESFIGSGEDNNIVNSSRSSIVGGLSNTITGSLSVILGGQSNTITGANSLVYGTQVALSASGSTVLTDSTASAFPVSTANFFAGRFAGGYGLTGGSVGIGTLYPNAPLSVYRLPSDTVGNVSVGFEYANAGSGTANELWGFRLSNTGYDFNLDRKVSGSWATTPALTILRANGNVGVGTTSPSTALQVHGVVTPDGDNTYTLGNATYRWSALYAANGTIQTSDRRLKSNIAPLTYGLSDILKLQPVSFTWTAQPEQGTKLGFIAQEVQPVMPEIVNVGDDAAHTLGLNYTEFIPAIVKAIQELSAKLDALAIIVANFAERITTKLLTAGEIHTDKLCVQGTCVTGMQLAALLSQTGAATTPISVSNSTAPDLTNSGNPADPNPGPDANASSTAPVIQLNGQNPAVIQVGDTYNDLGATIVSPDADKNLGIKTFLNGQLASATVLDTTQVATDTIDYVVTDPAGLAATSTRPVLIEPVTQNAAAQ